MGLPVPMEIITMAGGAILGGVMKLWGLKQQFQLQQQEMMMKMRDQTNDYRLQTLEKGNVHFQWTRRIIALTAVFSVLLLPKLVAVFKPELLVTVGWTEWNPGFLFFDGNEETVWKTLQGLVLTPLDTHAVSLILGLYFGGSIVGHR